MARGVRGGRHGVVPVPKHAPRRAPRYARTSSQAVAVTPARPPAPPASGLRSQWRRAWVSRKGGEQLLSQPLRTRLRDDYGDLSELRRVGRRPPLREYLTELWDRRYFIYAGARGEAVTRYSNERLGAFWYLLRPLLDATFYWLIFGVVLDVSGRVENFVAFILIGVFMFQLTARSITGGVGLIRNSKAMIRAFAFPRASLALTLVCRDALTSMPSIGMLLVLIMAIPPHALPTTAWLLVPVIFVVHLVTNLGLTLLFGWLGSRLPDLAQAMSFVSRLLLYASAVIFPIDRFIDQPLISGIIEANPIYQILYAYRSALIQGDAPSIDTWIMMAAWALGLLVVGFLLFWRDEERYTRV